ncbi:hypothetical protein [Streptomyces sp. NPDC088766]|uniref:hypothetical protein n=1 Tax=Streptomyces sp. NPDC088766 TaxID=3365893 RepID=UPI003807DC44
MRSGSHSAGRAHAYRWCAGRLATTGECRLAIRLSSAFGILPGHAVTPRADRPRPHAGSDALLAARAEQLGVPAGD